MAIPWTAYTPQAMQQHGARRTWPAPAESDRIADLKSPSARPDQAEDAASRVTPAARPSRP
jgi:hypothetical protein